ncbi:unnamed protein product [Meloidogyne enterolobii]|uniref:Uncharacterized protein n=1 Tax=Meloidogyne enterolobii TaxID=390850 RepID=A0ACB0ZY47_MELEN
MDLSAMMPIIYLRGLLLLLLSFSTLYSTRALKVYLLDTLNATSELNWRTYSNQDEKDGWLEETMYSRSENKNHQVYSTCNYESTHDAENWLLIPSVERGEAQRFYLHFNFTIVRCAAVEALRTSGCKETLKLYAAQFDESEEREFVKRKNWFNETKWDYVDTLASHSTTDTANNNQNKNEVERGGNLEEGNTLKDHQQQQSNNNQQQTYTQTSSYDVKKRYVHFALRNTGACSSILSVKIYYNVCPEYFSSLLHLPRTVSSRDPHGVVSVQGRCTSNSSPVATIIQQNSKNSQKLEKLVRRQFPALQPPTAICKADGSWQLVGSSTECVCDQGFVVSKINGMCTALPVIETIGEEEDEEEEIPVTQSVFGLQELPVTTESIFGQAIFLLLLFVILAITGTGIVLLITKIKVNKQNNNKQLVGNKQQLQRLEGNNGRYQSLKYPCIQPKQHIGPIISTSCQDCGTPRLQHECSTPRLEKQQWHNNNTFLTQTTPTSLKKQQHHLYVDPTTYEDPTQILAAFTNEIYAKDVEITRVIGSGEFGEVCCGRLTVEDSYGQRQQQIVAVKRLLPEASCKAKTDFLLEASIMGQFEHENVIRLIGVVTRTEPVMLITEYMLYGSLDQFLRANRDGQLTICQLVRLLHGIACGMNYLTDKAYVHRDLAARNVLVDDRLTCKIADFGLSRGLRPSNNSSGSGSPPFIEQEYTTQQGGKIPIRWTAPEAIMQHKYTTASDVWSFGVVMWEVLSFGERPYWDWSNHRVIQEVIHSGYRLPAPQDTPKRLYEIMMTCWYAERNLRPTFAQLLSQLNAFLTDVDFFYKYI